jgi:hypothetical protein
MSLRFSVADLCGELTSLELLASRRLDAASIGGLEKLSKDLKRYSRAVGETVTWGWPEDQPLRLRPSEGAYMRGAKGSETVCASIDCVWHLRVQSEQVVELVDNASVRVSMNEGELGLWRMEIAKHDSPGCFFHVQIGGEKDSEGKWPHTLDVPRFPGLVATPASVVEFVLGELFQEEWPEDLAKNGAAAAYLRGVQARWWTKLLTWQASEVQAADKSPWAALKTAQPPADLFCA